MKTALGYRGRGRGRISFYGGCCYRGAGPGPPRFVAPLMQRDEENLTDFQVGGRAMIDPLDVLPRDVVATADGAQCVATADVVDVIAKMLFARLRKRNLGRGPRSFWRW